MTDRTLGQVLDDYLKTEVRPGQYVQSFYLYHGDRGEPQAIVNTSEQDYDYTEIIFNVLNFREQLEVAKRELKSTQDKIRQLNKSKRDVEKAIELLRKS